MSYPFKETCSNSFHRKHLIFKNFFPAENCCMLLVASFVTQNLENFWSTICFSKFFSLFSAHMKIFSTHSLPSYPYLPLALFFVCPLFIEKIQNFKPSTAPFNCKKDFALLASPSYLNLKQFKCFIWIQIYSIFLLPS